MIMEWKLGKTEDIINKFQPELIYDFLVVAFASENTMLNFQKKMREILGEVTSNETKDCLIELLSNLHEELLSKVNNNEQRENTLKGILIFYEDLISDFCMMNAEFRSLERILERATKGVSINNQELQSFLETFEGEEADIMFSFQDLRDEV
eukprot:Pgem_evm2s940